MATDQHIYVNVTYVVTSLAKTSDQHRTSTPVLAALFSRVVP